MVVNPQRYGNDDMVELRLHQLSVTSNCRVPTEEAVEYTAPVKTEKFVEHSSHSFSSTNGVSFETFMEDAVSSYVPYWILKWGWWPILIFPVSIVIETLTFVLHFGVDLLFQRTVEECSIPQIDPSDYTNVNTYLFKNIDVLVVAIIMAGIMLLPPLLSAAEALLKGGITNLTGTQAAIVIAAILLVIAIALSSFLYIENLVSSGVINHGDAAFRYEMLAATVIGAMLGFDLVPGLWGQKTINYLNDVIKDKYGPNTTRVIKKGHMTKYIGLTLGVMVTLAAFFIILWFIHLAIYYQQIS